MASRASGGIFQGSESRFALLGLHGFLYWAMGSFHPGEQNTQPAPFQHHRDPQCSSEDDAGESALGKDTPHRRPPRCVHVHNKNGVGKVDNRILLAIKGQKDKVLVVGHHMPGPPMTPRFNSNNMVLIEDSGNPVGT